MSWSKTLRIGILSTIGMQRIVKECAVTATIACVVCVVALLIAQGRLASHALLDAPLAWLIFDICYFVSLQGVWVGVAIWGYSSERTALSDTFAVAINTIVWAMLAILLVEVVRLCRRFVANYNLPLE